MKHEGNHAQQPCGLALALGALECLGGHVCGL